MTHRIQTPPVPETRRRRLFASSLQPGEIAIITNCCNQTVIGRCVVRTPKGVQTLGGGRNQHYWHTSQAFCQQVSVRRLEPNEVITLQAPPLGHFEREEGDSTLCNTASCCGNCR